LAKTDFGCGDSKTDAEPSAGARRARSVRPNPV